MGAGASAKKRGAEGKLKSVVREKGDKKAGLLADSKGSAVVVTPGDTDGGQKVDFRCNMPASAKVEHER